MFKISNLKFQIPKILNPNSLIPNKNMTYEGVLTKMQTEFSNPIQYYLVFENSFLSLNQLLDKSLEINFVGYQCLNCVKKKKIFRQGFCYDCFMVI